jgi:hypothetical protein
MNENKHEGESEVEGEAQKRRMSCTLEEMASISSPCLPPPSRLHIKAIGCPVKSNSTSEINKPKASAIVTVGYYRSIRINDSWIDLAVYQYLRHSSKCRKESTSIHLIPHEPIIFFSTEDFSNYAL